MQALANYIRGSIEELNHVTWPTRQQAVRLSIIVIVFVIISATVLGVVDNLLGRVIAAILG